MHLDCATQLEYIPIPIATPKEAATTHAPVPSHLPDPNVPVQVRHPVQPPLPPRALER
jgi:hypothetical protein